MKKYFLAVDGGGTKTDVVCADEDGLVVGTGLAGPTNLTSTSVGASSFNLIEGVRQAVENLPRDEEKEFSVLAMGLAGLDSDKEHSEAYKIFTESLRHYNIAKFILVNDALIALENGSENVNSLILISGTGSNCFGRNENGETAKTSGMDFLLADQGSGYAIGRRVLREAVKSFDGRSKKTILENLVTQYFNIKSISDLKNEVYNPLLSKIEIANLSYLCTQAQAQGDVTAQEILDKTVGEVVVIVSTVVDKLNLNSKNFDCVFSGSVIKLDYLNDKVSQILKEKYSNINLILPDDNPVLGALKIAMKSE